MSKGRWPLLVEHLIAQAQERARRYREMTPESTAPTSELVLNYLIGHPHNSEAELDAAEEWLRRCRG